jgi:carbon-monoxide dehydrogenase large subunit
VSQKLVGVPVTRQKALQLVAGRGVFTDDLRFPGMLHAVYLRSPHAHARIISIDLDQALSQPGIVAVFRSQDLLAVCEPWTTRFVTLPAHRSVPQPPLAHERAVWQGQPVVMILGETRALAEDAIAFLDVDWEPLTAVSGLSSAFGENAPLVHPELRSNLMFQYSADTSAPDKTFAKAKYAVSREFSFSRHTGVPLEPRSIIAQFDVTQRQLTVHASTQAPHQMRAVLSAQLKLDEHRVRVIVPDVGGAFGIKLHVYDDEIAVAAATMIVGRPVKFVSDRLEAFTSDVHARSHQVKASLAVDADGKMLAFSTDDMMEAGAFSVYPRSSVLEGMRAVTAVGAPYSATGHSAKLRIAFQNKPPVGSYRGVGQPIACAVTEMLVDAAARRAGIDPAQFRRQNYRSAADLGNRTAGGLETGGELSFVQCLDKLLAMMGYSELRARQLRAREAQRYFGIGLATFVENSAAGPMFYGGAGIPIAASDGCTLRLEPSGTITCITSAQFQGQGLETGLTQIIAETLGISMEAVRIVHGDTAITPVGGGSWASRGMTIAGEATLRAAAALRDRILAVVAALLQASVTDLELRDSAIWVRGTNTAHPLSEIAFTLHYRQHLLPPHVDAEPVVTRHFASQRPYFLSNGIQGSFVEVDPDTGFVRLLQHWVVDDCGRIINPLLVDEQLRGGVVQGIGAALYEELCYDETGQLLNASMSDYLVPMAAEMPDIEIGHVETPVSDTMLGVKGVGEAGLIGASAAVANAVNDALAPLGAELTELPMTPLRILRTLKRIP